MALTMTPATYAQIPPALPILIQNGIEDTSATVESVRALIGRLAEIGAMHVTWRLYPDLRHDLIHETRRGEVGREISAWLEQITNSSR